MTEQELRSRLESLTGEIPAETHRAFLSAASPGKEAKVMKKKISAGLVFALVGGTRNGTEKWILP